MQDGNKSGGARALGRSDQSRARFPGVQAGWAGLMGVEYVVCN